MSEYTGEQEVKYTDAEKLKEIFPKGIGDVKNARVDTEFKYDLNFANEYIQKHNTTEYMNNQYIADRDDLNQLAELILKEAFLQGRMGESVTDIQLVEWSTVGGVRYKQGADWKYYRLVAKESVNGLATVFRKLSKVDISKSGEADITGRITRTYNGEEAVFRVAFSPNIRSQTTTARLQDAKTLDMGLDDLGMPKEYVDVIKQKVEQRNGLILLSGGKGEGKTTTIYAMLIHVLRESEGKKNIMTVEDPVEYTVDGIVQSNIDRFTGYDFAQGVQVKFREAPDVLLNGEMNDDKSVFATIDMGTGGNLTISSIHANDVLAIPQVIYNRSKGTVSMDMVGNSLQLLMHQSLHKKLCPKCKKEIIVNTEEQSWIQDKLNVTEFVGTQYIRASEEDREKCDLCGGTGYKGRVLIVEMLDASSKTFTNELFKGEADPIGLKEKLMNDKYTIYYPMEKDVFRRFKEGDISLAQAKELIH